MKKIISLFTLFTILATFSLNVYANDNSIIEEYTIVEEISDSFTPFYEDENEDNNLMLEDYEVTDIIEDEIAAVNYHSVRLSSGECLTINNTNSRSLSIKMDNACQYVTYSSDGELKNISEKKNKCSISIPKGGKALVANSGSDTLTIQGDERYFNDYSKNYALIYVDITLSARESFKFVNKTKKSSKISIVSLPETYAYIKYKNMDNLSSCGKWKTSKNLSVNKDETLIITNESDSANMTIHFSPFSLENTPSHPAYEEKKLSIGSSCVVNNNTSKSLKMYTKNFVNKKFKTTIKSNSSKTFKAKSFGVYIYVPYGFMSIE